MKELLISFFIALVAGAAINGCMQPSANRTEGASTEQSAEPSNTLVAQTSDATFQNDVLDSNLPVLVDVFADWCGPCRKMTPVVDEVASDFSNQLKVYRLNADENQEITARYDAHALPTFIVFKEGKPVTSFTGSMPKDELENRIRPYLN